jgi:hypothetical protein
MQAICPAQLILLDLIILITSDGSVQFMKLFVTCIQFSPASYYFIRLRSEYSPQHLVL